MALRVGFNSARNLFIRNGLFNRSFISSQGTASTRRALKINNILNRQHFSSHEKKGYFFFKASLFG